MVGAQGKAMLLRLTLAVWASTAALTGAVTHGPPAQVSVAPLAAAPRGAEVAACRRRGNLFAFYRPLARCMPLLDEAASPCLQPGALLVLNDTTQEAYCRKLPCLASQVLLADGRCHDKQHVCAGRDDMELVLLETGLGSCDCRDGHLFWRADSRCYRAFTRGPCARDEHVVWSGGQARCEPAPCAAENQVPWRGKCVPRQGHGCLDSVHGHLQLNPATLRYQCTLHCPDAMVEVGLDCHALYSRGPCAFGEYVEPVRGTRYGRCAPNPCEQDGLLPWAGRCWRAGETCTAEDDDDWEETATAVTRATRAPPSLFAMAYSDLLLRNSAATASSKKVLSAATAAEVSQAVRRVPVVAASERAPFAAPILHSSPPATQPLTSTTVATAPTTPTAPTAPTAPTTPTAPTAPTAPTTPTTTTGMPPVPSGERPSLPLHLQYLLGGAPKLDQLPFMRHRRPPSAAVSEALVARRSLVPPPPPPPPAASGLLELLGLPAFHGQASETSVSSIPAPMLRPVQYTYDGKPIRNPLFGDRRRRRRAVPAAAPRIVVHPVTRQVTCSSGAPASPPETYARFKCRPGSLRDALGECRHGAATWSELHPRHCPYGMRHNRLTGQCRPAA